MSALRGMTAVAGTGAGSDREGRQAAGRGAPRGRREGRKTGARQIRRGRGPLYRPELCIRQMKGRFDHIIEILKSSWAEAVWATDGARDSDTWLRKPAPVALMALRRSLEALLQP